MGVGIPWRWRTSWRWTTAVVGRQDTEERPCDALRRVAFWFKANALGYHPSPRVLLGVKYSNGLGWRWTS